MSLYLLLAGVICHGSNAKDNDKYSKAVNGLDHGSRVGLMPDWVRLRLAAWGLGGSQAVSQASCVRLAGMANAHEVISNANPASAGIPTAMAHVDAVAVSFGGEIPANGIAVLVGGE
jgi:hypothetical protein